MSFETIELSRQGPIALLGLSRPDKLNAINATMIDEINQALDQFEKDDSVHAIVVHGNGRAFSSGFDLQAGVAANRTTEAEWRVAIDAVGVREVIRERAHVGIDPGLGVPGILPLREDLRVAVATLGGRGETLGRGRRLGGRKDGQQHPARDERHATDRRDSSEPARCQ